MYYPLTGAPFRVAELDVTACAGRVLPGSLRGEQVLNLCVEGLDGGINLVVLGSQGRLISSVLIVSGDVISATSRAGRSLVTGRSGGTLIWLREGVNMQITVALDHLQGISYDVQDNRGLSCSQSNQIHC